MPKPLTTILTGKPGRPAHVSRRAAKLIGNANVAALRAAGLHIVPGRILRELAIIVGEAGPCEVSVAPTTSVVPMPSQEATHA